MAVEPEVARTTSLMSPKARLRVTPILACCLALLGLQAFPAEAGAYAVYVADNESRTVTVIDSRTNTVIGSRIALGAEVEPVRIAISPDGARAYVASPGLGDLDEVVVIDTRTNQVISRIKGLDFPREIAVAPDGQTAYVEHQTGNSPAIAVIDTRTNQVVGDSIREGASGEFVVSPDGRNLYVVGREQVVVIDTRTRQRVREINIERDMTAIAVAPDGRTAYVAGSTPDAVFVVDLQAGKFVGNPIPVGDGEQNSIAIAPNGQAVYVTDNATNTVSVIDTRTNQVVGIPIPVGALPTAPVVSPDGKAVYVASEATSSVSVIDTRTNQVVGTIPVGDEPEGLAIVPNQPPAASFSSRVVRPRVPAVFDAGASRDADGSIASFNWSFEGAPAFAAVSMISHTFPRPGTFTVVLSLTDDGGCSTTQIFTGQTVHCNGSGVAAQTATVKVAYPGVRVRCPAKTESRRCSFTLQVVTKARKGKPKTRVAKASAKRGKAAIVSLKPKARYAKQLARAKKVLVKVTLKTGDTQRTTFRKLKIVR